MHARLSRLKYYIAINIFGNDSVSLPTSSMYGLQCKCLNNARQHQCTLYPISSDDYATDR
eukprot:2270-Heterococcus_DN1.PRE.6